MVDDLVNTYLLMEADVKTLEDISAFSKRLQLLDGEVLIHENETENFDLYVICSGAVEILSSSSTAVSSDVAISKQNRDIFGEISWITRKRRTATVRCRGEVEAIRIDGEKFMSYLSAHPQTGFLVMRRIAGLLCERMASTDQLLKQILWNSPF